MLSAHKKKLTSKRSTLCKELLVGELLQELIEKEIFNDHLAERVLSQQTTLDKNVEFLRLLPGRGPRAFTAFCSALVNSYQSHLAEMLDPAPQAQNVSPPDRSSSNGGSGEYEPSASYFPTESIATANSNYLGTSRTCTSSPLSRRRPMENINQASTSNASPQVIYANQGTPPKRNRESSSFYIEQMDNAPSPTNSLSNIRSTASIQSLFSRSGVRTLSNTAININSVQGSSSTNAATSYQINSNQGMDSFDGPTFEDFEVQISTDQFRDRMKDKIDCYPMKSGSKGAALIISVEQGREGSEKDRFALELVLQQIGFECYVLINGTAEQIVPTLEKFADLDKRYHYSCSLVAVMSHGDAGCFFGSDGVAVAIDYMVNFFSNQNCHSLQNIPKIFLIQACQGDEYDMGVDEVDGPTQAPVGDVDNTSTSSSNDHIKNKLPQKSDILICQATMNGFAAVRNSKHGSWYIQAVVRVLARHAHDTHFLDMMIKVNNILKDMEAWYPDTDHHRCKQMSVIKENTLTNKIYFFPGH
ncbi:caspase-2-like [Ciona intestinalis]